MTHLDQMIADALAQSPDTVVHQLASEVVRLRRGQIDRVPACVKLDRITSERSVQAWRKARETYLAAHPDADLRRVPAADVVRFGRGGR